MAVTVISGGAKGGTPQFGTFGSFAQANAVYVTPGYLLRAARRKYGQGIYVIGALQSALDEFWDTVESKGENVQEPAKEVSRIITDITAKEHCNYGTSNDKMEVETSQEKTRKEKKTYSLSFGKQSGWEFGGGLNIGASFFNTASASFGIQGKRLKSKSSSEEEGKEEERSLSQKYGAKAAEITVPPETKVHLRITTYAVTYKAKIKVVVSAPATSYIPFYYKSCLGKFFCPGVGPTFRKFGFITARELFQSQSGFEDLGYCIQFIKDSELSYIGETAEMSKTEHPLPKQPY